MEVYIYVDPRDEIFFLFTQKEDFSDMKEYVVTMDPNQVQTILNCQQQYFAAQDFLKSAVANRQ